MQMQQQHAPLPQQEMLTRPIGRLAASAVGLGTWAMGGWMWGGTRDRDSIAAIHAALDAGITLIDTAPIYGFGHCETLVGQALAGGRREQVVLATKCGMVWDHEAGEFYFTSDAAHPDPAAGQYRVYRSLRPASIRQEVEQSLRRLRTDRIDLYQTHWQERTTPIEDTMAALLQLQQEGKIVEIGVSNCAPEELAAYIQVGGVAAAQEGFSLLERRAEAALLPQTRAAGLAFLAYSALSMGLLSGELGPERVFAAGDQRARRRRFSPEARQQAQQALAALRPLAHAHGASISGLILARTLQVPGVTHVLCGARDAAQAEENAAAGRLSLSVAEIAWIDAAVAQITP